MMCNAPFIHCCSNLETKWGHCLNCKSNRSYRQKFNSVPEPTQSCPLYIDVLTNEPLGCGMIRLDVLEHNGFFFPNVSVKYEVVGHGITMPNSSWFYEIYIHCTYIIIKLQAAHNPNIRGEEKKKNDEKLMKSCQTLNAVYFTLLGN